LPAFRDFVAMHRSEIAHLIETRVTNTNEVGRSSILHPAFRALAQSASAPFHLVEIGPSAGLNLIWDRYGVRFTREGQVLSCVAPEANLVLDCEVKGSALPPAGPAPAVASRVGLEANRVDLSNRDDRDWLRALVWPNEPERLRRLDRAIALFDRDKPEIRFGDALDLLPDALAEAPRDATLCVYHTITVYQFGAEMREALESILTVAGLRRAVFRIGLEYTGLECLLTLYRYADGVRDERVLAISHPHGRWLEWRA
jgi:hypothetical protein